MVASTKGLGPEKDCAGKEQQHVQKTDPSSCQRGRPTKQDRNCQTVINIRSWAPHGAREQDLLTHWQSVAMWLWFASGFGSWKPLSSAPELQWDRRQPARTWSLEQENWGILWRWKSLPGNNRWRYSRLRRLSTCCRGLQSVWISDSVIVTCSYDL
jgi:hypothetical protein